MRGEKGSVTNVANGTDQRQTTVEAVDQTVSGPQRFLPFRSGWIASWLLSTWPTNYLTWVERVEHRGNGNAFIMLISPKQYRYGHNIDRVEDTTLGERQVHGAHKAFGYSH